MAAMRLGRGQVVQVHQRVAEIEPARSEGRRLSLDGFDQGLACFGGTGQGIEGGAAQEVQFGAVGCIAERVGGFSNNCRMVADGRQRADQNAAGTGMRWIAGQGRAGGWSIAASTCPVDRAA